MKYYSFLIKPSSSACDLRCQYCFYEDVSNHRSTKQYPMMSFETVDILLDQVFCEENDALMVNFAFQGGEPTLIGLSFFEYFVDRVHSLAKETDHIQYSIQTNGYRLNSDWYAFFKKYDFLVGVSLDGYREIHDQLRKDSSHQGTFQTILKHIKEMDKYGVRYNILTVLTKQLAKHPSKLYQFYKKQKFSYVQLIPCLPSFDLNAQEDPFALTPELFASFYKVFFRYWYEDLKKGHYLQVGLFENLIPMLSHIPPTQCGMLGFCSFQYVIESDGSIYPCDFYVLDQYRLGSLHEQTLDEVLKSHTLQKFLHEPKTLSKRCEKCRFYHMCYGNCKRMRLAYFDDIYCGYEDFLESVWPQLSELAVYLRQ